MLRVVGCFLEYEGKFVLLLRHPHKPNGSTWGLPAGKVEKDEATSVAARRELWEETGYLAGDAELEFLREDVYQLEDGPVLFAVYRVILHAPHAVQIETAAHQAFRWVTPQECYAMQDLIPGLHTALERTLLVDQV